MAEYELDTSQLPSFAKKLYAGDRVILSGVAYTARDAAHSELSTLLDRGEMLPFDLRGATVYYAGPTEAPPNLPIGSCGPTTSSRMDAFSPRLLDLGLCCMIGKGPRSEDVVAAMIRNNAVYLCAIGGAGALAAKCISSCEVVAFSELGCESIKKIKFNHFPVIVGIDAGGSSIFK